MAVMQKKIEFEFMYVCALARTLLYKKAYWPYTSHYKMMTISELFLISLIQLVKGNYQKANMGSIRLGPNRRSVVDTDLDSLRP